MSSPFPTRLARANLSWQPRTLSLGLVLAACVLGNTGLANAQAPAASVAERPAAAVPRVDREIDWETVTNPSLGLRKPELGWALDVKPIWLASLRHTESDLRREVAESILQAHRAGMPGLVELKEALGAVLEDPAESLVTKTSVAAALVALDCRDLAPQLAAHAADGSPRMKTVIERGLARWDYQPMREIWLARLADASMDPQWTLLAAESLAEVGEPRAIEPLSRMLLSNLTPGTLRLASARALAKLKPEEALAWSRQLQAGTSRDARLEAQCGVELLAEQSSPEAIELLESYVDHPAPSVAGVALNRLLKIEPARVLARAEQMVVAADANLRRITMMALAGDPTPRSVGLLAQALGDRVPSLRRGARRILLRLAARDDLRSEVIERSAEALATDAWRAKEQALIVLTELQHRAINDQLPALTDDPRDEVRIAAAWAIKHLFEPDRGATVLDLATRITTKIEGGGPIESDSFVQAHLLEALGLLKHRPAVALLLKPLPKGSPYVVEARAAAIWSLGFVLNPQEDAASVRLLEERLADANSVPMEYPEVRAAAAIALGRIADPASLKELRNWQQYDGPNTPVGRSCGWAIMQMTGEPLPPAITPQRQIVNWSIEPIFDP